MNVSHRARHCIFLICLKLGSRDVIGLMRERETGVFTAVVPQSPQCPRLPVPPSQIRTR
uniref:Uncharacterized protein n=1 Tax=Anguilla anguilla TaxID=7936 RepID=A0A0E9SRI4_ANGAN